MRTLVSLVVVTLLAPRLFQAATPTFAGATAQTSVASAFGKPAEPGTIRLNGVIEPVRSQHVSAPRIGGVGPSTGPPQPLVLIRLARAGTLVRKGDLLVE